MKRLRIRRLTDNALIAAIYAVITIIQGSLGYGEIQFRIAEVLIILAFFRKDFIFGLTIGCALANIASPLQPWDMIFGTLATLISVTIIAFSKYMWIGIIVPALANGVIIGLELHLILKLPLLYTMFGVFIGEIVVLVVGYLIFSILRKDKKFMLLILSTRDQKLSTN